MIVNLIDFIIESNNIEGENTRPDSELPVYEWWLVNECNEGNLKEFHKRLCDARDQLKKNERGVYRKVPVYIGKKEFPPPNELSLLMKEFFDKRRSVSPFLEHRLYENIHPFVDLNGRTGRAIWLHRMLQIQDVTLGFLHTWYYQSL